MDYLLEGTVNGAASALDWLAEREGAPLAVLLAESDAALAAGETPPLFINGVSGLGAPFWVSNLESRFVGTGSRGARVLAVLESIAFLLQVNLEELQGARTAAHPTAGDRRAVGQRLSLRLPGQSCRAARLPGPTIRKRRRGGWRGWWQATGAADWALPQERRQAPATSPNLQARYARWRAALDAAIRDL